jgi:hypothetical protein
MPSTFRRFKLGSPRRKRRGEQSLPRSGRGRVFHLARGSSGADRVVVWLVILASTGGLVVPLIAAGARS